MSRQPFEPDRIRDLFQDLDAPPGVGRWREVGPSRVLASRRPPVKRSRPALVLGSVFAAVVVLAMIPLAGQMWRQTEAATTEPPHLVAPASDGPAPTGTTQGPKPTGPATPRPVTTPPARNLPTTAPPSGPGVPAGLSLDPHTGELVVTQAGAVIDGLAVNGPIVVRAPGVTIRNTRVTTKGYWAIKQESRATDLTVSNSEITGGAETGISQDAAGLTVSRVLIRGVGTGIAVRDKATVQDSRLVDVATGVVSQGGVGNLLIRRNTITATARGEAAVALYTHAGPLTGVLVADNTLAGGQYTVYGGEGTGCRDVRFTGNRFSRAVHPDGGFYGPLAAWDGKAPGNLWQGNTWSDSGSTVSP